MCRELVAPAVQCGSVLVGYVRKAAKRVNRFLHICERQRQPLGVGLLDPIVQHCLKIVARVLQGHYQPHRERDIRMVLTGTEGLASNRRINIEHFAPGGAFGKLPDRQQQPLLHVSPQACGIELNELIRCIQIRHDLRLVQIGDACLDCDGPVAVSVIQTLPQLIHANLIVVRGHMFQNTAHKPREHGARVRLPGSVRLVLLLYVVHVLKTTEPD